MAHHPLARTMDHCRSCPVFHWIGILSLLFFVTACGHLAREDDSVFAAGNSYFEQHDVQRREHADPSDLPVQVNFAVHHKPVLERDMAVDFEFVPQQASPYLGIGFRTTEGLEWVAGPRQFSYQDVKKFAILKQRIRVKPVEEGEFYISVYVVMQVDGEKRAKSFQIPIPLGVNTKPEAQGEISAGDHAASDP
jgi:hypothetical protein